MRNATRSVRTQAPGANRTAGGGAPPAINIRLSARRHAIGTWDTFGISCIYDILKYIKNTREAGTVDNRQRLVAL